MDTTPSPSTYVSPFAPPIPLTPAQLALLKAQYEERMYAKLLEAQRQEEDKRARRESRRLEKARRKSCEPGAARGRLSLGLGLEGKGRRNCGSVDACRAEREGMGAVGDGDGDRGRDRDRDGAVDLMGSGKAAEEGRKGSVAFWRGGSKLKNGNVVG